MALLFMPFQRLQKECSQYQ
ncbi:TPA: hypothetical protein ANIA_11547 [Aspergillus nidulans FGSC A4]|uniref:Uncharacterized protein n=1 Tax=Emericella nidulans (strain FGSC A4 / ATCC 38163 / CBS 112.46 / NRRL 194 / M139) TaxID=227321 RepID=C8VD99_EMENI|nr:TPA: hypothetical protein ANIA_11547 [Aspergillus nidulans FGSC A4]